jgi:hypothetical protein
LADLRSAPSSAAISCLPWLPSRVVPQRRLGRLEQAPGGLIDLPVMVRAGRVV